VVATGVPSGGAGASTVTVSGGPATSTAGATTSIVAERIRIERLDIDLKIIDGDGVDAPIGKVAHYPGTAWPGDGSNIYIYGHAREGMFINLWKAKVGDVIELDLVDGTTRTYLVDEVLPKVPWDAVKYLRPTETEQLTLQTSTSYHPTSPRFIVIASPTP
jgi:LPXTG-site transpeptidase (sortase) family protein